MAQNIDIVISAKDTATKSINEAKNAIKWLSSSVEQMKGIAWTAFSAMKTGALALWTAIWGLWAFWVKAGADMEQVNIAFKTLYWSSDQARKTLEQLADFAAKTPFEFPELADSALKLQNIAGISKDQLIPTLTSLGDIASSQWKSIDQMTEAFNDAVVWEFERLKEFWIRASQEWDRVTFTYKGQTTVVQKNNEAIADYITKLWHAQGVAGSMDAQSGTLNWRLSTMKDNFKFLAMDIVGVSKAGEIVKGWFFDKISQAVNALGSWMEQYKPQIMWFFKSIWDVAKKVAEVTIEWFKKYGGEAEKLGKTIQKVFENDWPIAMEFLMESLKAGLELIGVALIGLNQIISGEFVKTMQEWFSELSDFIKRKFDEIWQYFKNFATNMVNEAKMFAINFMGMLGDGITESMWALQSKVENVANVFSDYLGFHSPTKKGPGSDADKWMPNLMKMLVTWLSSWENSLTQATVRIAKILWGVWSPKEFANLKNVASDLKRSIENAFDWMSGKVTEQKSKVLSLKNEYSDLKKKLKEVGDVWQAEIARINQEISNREIGDIRAKEWWKMEVANRILEIEKEIARAKQDGEWQESSIIAKLEAEKQLAKQYVTEWELAVARMESEKTETQLILDRIAKREAENQAEMTNLLVMKQQKQQAIEEEKQAVLLLMQQKKTEILSEQELYKSLIEKRTTLDEQYFTIFRTRIQEQMDSTRQAINLMNELNSKWAGNYTPIAQNEVFNKKAPTTQWGGFSFGGMAVNIGDMVVNSKNDADYFVEKIRSTFIRELQLSKLGIN